MTSATRDKHLATTPSPLPTLLTMTGMETRLLTREWAPMLFAFVFPPMMMLVLAGVFANDSGPEFLGQNGTDYYIAAYLAVPMAALALIGLPVALTGYRERGVLRRLTASGVSQLSVIGAQVLVTSLLVVLGAGLVLSVAAPIYGLPEVDNPAGVIAAFALGTAMMLTLGVVVGLAVATARSAQALGLLLFMPMWLLGGGGPPAGVMTGAMQTISGFLPTTPLTTAIRDAWLGGGDITEPMLLTAAWLVGGLVVGAVLLRRRRHTP
jgi:ABC-2 type transport system permease protein